MLAVLFIAIFGAMVGLTAYELISEVRDAKHELKDRYHE